MFSPISRVFPYTLRTTSSSAQLLSVLQKTSLHTTAKAMVVTMGSDEEKSSLPSILNGTKTGTFVYETIKDRWPTIVSKLVNQFHTKHRELPEIYGDEANQDIKDILAHLSEMRYRMMTNKPLELLEDKFKDVRMYNKLLQERIDADEQGGQKATWFDADWLFVECYLYRRIYGVVYSTKVLSQYDYFKDQKCKGFTQHSAQIIDALTLLKSYLSTTSNNENDEIHLSALFKQCIWGNRADLSLSAGEHTVHDNDSEALAALDHLLIVNDLPRLFHYIRKMRNKSGSSRRVDIILDNAGMELASDMIFAEFILANNIADEVIFHMKKTPWFVSDVNKSDWVWTIEAFKKLQGELGPCFGRQMEKRVKEESIKLRDDLFWTSPHPFCLMKEVAPAIYEDLSKSGLLIFKGDLNYRKLVGDRTWQATAPFSTAVQGFRPAPFVALRCLKAETVAGLSDGSYRHLLSQYKDSNEWMVSGTHAVIQFHE